MHDAAHAYYKGQQPDTAGVWGKTGTQREYDNPPLLICIMHETIRLVKGYCQPWKFDHRRHKNLLGNQPYFLTYVLMRRLIMSLRTNMSKREYWSRYITHPDRELLHGYKATVNIGDKDHQGLVS